MKKMGEFILGRAAGAEAAARHQGRSQPMMKISGGVEVGAMHLCICMT